MLCMPVCCHLGCVKQSHPGFVFVDTIKKNTFIFICWLFLLGWELGSHGTGASSWISKNTGFSLWLCILLWSCGRDQMVPKDKSLFWLWVLFLGSLPEALIATYRNNSHVTKCAHGKCRQSCMYDDAHRHFTQERFMPISEATRLEKK